MVETVPYFVVASVNESDGRVNYVEGAYTEEEMKVRVLSRWRDDWFIYELVPRQFNVQETDVTIRGNVLTLT